MKKIILLLAVMGLMSACGKKNTEENSSSLEVDPVEAAVESGITMVSGMADEQSGGSFALQSVSPTSIWEVMLGPKAYAANCVRPYYSSCSSGVKSAVYDACDIAGTSRTITGHATLTYSHMSCTLASNGDTVTRTYDIDISGPRGGVVSHSSDSGTDYRGSTYGGGGRLTKTAGGWDAEILGRHSAMTFRGHNVFNVSVRTLVPLNVSGSLARASRVVSGGQLEVNHNIAQFTAVISPTNLTWTNSCCHPVSGSLSVNYSGSKSGSATVTFTGCGSATVNEGGQQKTIELSYCE